MSNHTLFPYQQEIVDRLMALSKGRTVYEIPVGGHRFSGSADRANERAPLAVDIEASGRAVNAVSMDFSDAERRVMRSAMFGIRYGKSAWKGSMSHCDNARAFFQDVIEVPPRKTLMYYHVQSALMSWS